MLLLMHYICVYYLEPLPFDKYWHFGDFGLFVLRSHTAIDRTNPPLHASAISEAACCRGGVEKALEARGGARREASVQSVVLLRRVAR